MKNYAIDRLTRTAFHESGHAVCATLLGHQPGPVTIVGNDARAGCTLRTSNTYDVASIHDWLDQPVVMWPAAVRQTLEVDLMVAMAGRIAETLIPDRTEGPLADPFAYEQAAFPDHPWPGPDRLTPAEEHDLAVEAARLPEEVRHDPEQVAHTAWMLFGPAERRAWRHGRWLHAETVALLERNIAAVERVARALLEHRTLGGADVARLVRGG